MEVRRLGDSGLKVSETGLGCNNFGMRIGQDAAQIVVDAAIEAGITLFDTADMYGQGQSETMLGKALGARRQSVVVATKFGQPMGDAAHRQGASRRWIMQAVDESLARLGTDYIDLYQIHFPDPATPIDETLRALEDVVKAGKVRYIGNSNFTGWMIADADWTARDQRLTRFVSAQNGYSLLDRKAEQEVLPACTRFGLGFLPYFPLASGLLTGKYKRGEPPAQDTRMAAWGERAARALNDQNFDKVEALSAYAEARGRTLLDLAFAWLLGHPQVSSVIAGATRAEQIGGNVKASTWRLTSQEMTEIDALAA
ncbi:MAG: aldo/keto reductase [Phenylobacterium sp.]|uniref:aldo/keto reductase n=1 Tax=Phenylobacterium sp. TaxID=1871053 RepID=UPI00273393D5|nr:aldo/keto reductase [Phenylobacterium sp.]MDP3175488.1 aldo/keto reductase [Phenylobacterium sp.]